MFKSNTIGSIALSIALFFTGAFVFYYLTGKEKPKENKNSNLPQSSYTLMLNLDNAHKVFILKGDTTIQVSGDSLGVIKELVNNLYTIAYQRDLSNQYLRRYDSLAKIGCDTVAKKLADSLKIK